MKYMFASDIHGSAYYCRKMLEAFQEEKEERLVLLGDILYHVRGNCDAEVDQMVLEFPVLADYGILIEGGHTF